MSKAVINLILLWVVLVAAQVVVFDHLCLWNTAVPIVFIYIILRLPVTMHAGWLLTIGFFTGLVVDAFADTYGLNATCCTLLAGVRRPMLRMYVSRVDELAPPEPSMASMGVPAFAKYLVTATLFYCILVFVLEAFTFFYFWRMLLRIICSTVLSALLMAGVDALTSPRK